MKNTKVPISYYFPHKKICKGHLKGLIYHCYSRRTHCVLRIITGTSCYWLAWQTRWTTSGGGRSWPGGGRGRRMHEENFVFNLFILRCSTKLFDITETVIVIGRRQLKFSMPCALLLLWNHFINSQRNSIQRLPSIWLSQKLTYWSSNAELLYLGSRFRVTVLWGKYFALSDFISRLFDVLVIITGMR